MKAAGRVRAGCGEDGRLRLPVLRSEPPLVLRRTAEGVTLVAGAGGPLGDDDLSLDVAVDAGARLHVGSAAATVVQPDVRGQDTCLNMTAAVADGGLLVWEPEPTVVAAGARLTMRTTIRCGRRASLVWREVVALGRSGERGGRVTTSMTIDSDRPVLRQSTTLGAGAPTGWDGPAVAGGRRVLGTLVLLGGCAAADAGAPLLRETRVERVVLRLDAGGVLVSALGDTTLDVVRALNDVGKHFRPSSR